MGFSAYFNNGQFYNFDGPYTSTDLLRKQSGVYLISTKQPNGLHKIIDIGESEDVHKRVSTHDRGPEWRPHAIDTLYVSVLYCEEQSRMIIEQQLRTYHNPPVGVK